MKTIYHDGYRKLISELRRARVQAGMTQKDAADRMGVLNTWISKVENCDIRIDVVQLCRLCGVYDLRVAELIRDIEEGMLAIQPR
jgi:transcriptional regulator with XRE-family HTH domain